MRKKIIFVICLYTFLLYGCDSDTDMTDSYLGNLQVTYDESNGQEEQYDFFTIPSLTYSSISITDTEDNLVSTPVIEYAGGRFTYKLYTNISQTQENGPESFKRVFYILIDGYLQPFYFEESDEMVLYAVIDSNSGEEFSYTFSFDPMYVPYGANAVLTFVVSNSPDYFQEKATEQVFCSSIEQTYCLTALSSEYAVEYEKKENPAEVMSDFPAGDSQTAGIILAEKIENTEQFRINTLINTDKQLYAATVCTEDADIRLFAVVDGKLADIFDGSYYVDLSMKAGNTYEVPLDMELLTRDEMHQLYFVKADKQEIEEFSQCSAAEEMILHSVVAGEMEYAFAVTVN